VCSRACSYRLIYKGAGTSREIDKSVSRDRAQGNGSTCCSCYRPLTSLLKIESRRADAVSTTGASAPTTERTVIISNQILFCVSSESCARGSMGLRTVFLSGPKLLLALRESPREMICTCRRRRHPTMTVDFSWRRRPEEGSIARAWLRFRRPKPVLLARRELEQPFGMLWCCVLLTSLGFSHFLADCVGQDEHPAARNIPSRYQRLC
jgi:hypothetical protein